MAQVVSPALCYMTAFSGMCYMMTAGTNLLHELPGTCTAVRCESAQAACWLILLHALVLQHAHHDFE